MDIIRSNIKYFYDKDRDTWKVEQLLPKFLGVFVVAGELNASRGKTIEKYNSLIGEVYKPMALRSDYFAPEKMYTVQFDNVDVRTGECNVVEGRSFVELWGTRKPMPVEMKALREQLAKEFVFDHHEMHQDWSGYDNWEARPTPVFV